jgi:NarL family two-component system response regulator LiaR
MIRVVIADDYDIVRRGLCLLLKRARDIEPVGEAADGREAVELVRKLEPDVLLMDVAMPGLDGIQATELISRMDVPTKVLIVSMYNDSHVIHEAQLKGACGFLPKKDVFTHLQEAIEAVCHGDDYFQMKSGH